MPVQRSHRFCKAVHLTLATIQGLTGRRQCAHVAAGDDDPVIGQAPVVLTDQSQQTLTVATFNIKFGLEADRAASELAEISRFRRPDVILLQEMDPDGTARIASDLGFQFVYAPAVVHSRHGRLFGQAVLSPWPLRDVQVVPLPHLHPVNGQRRIALLVTVEVAGREVRACSIHTETALLPASCRREQVAVALAALADWDGPAVVGGDFNTVTRANVLDLARAGKAAGFHRIGGYGPTVEWKAAGLRLRRFVLDHVLHRGLVASTGAATVDTAASDHRSVWATFELPPLPEPQLAEAV